MKVAFLGGGSFATSLSNLIGKKGFESIIWARNKDVVNEINNERKNSKYLKDVELNHNVNATDDIKKALKDADYVVIAVASHAIREVCKKAKPFIEPDARIINVAKGIEEGTYKLLTDVISEELPHN